MLWFVLSYLVLLKLVKLLQLWPNADELIPTLKLKVLRANAFKFEAAILRHGNTSPEKIDVTIKSLGWIALALACFGSLGWLAFVNQSESGPADVVVVRRFRCA